MSDWLLDKATDLANRAQGDRGWTQTRWEAERIMYISALRDAHRKGRAEGMREAAAQCREWAAGCKRRAQNPLRPKIGAARDEAASLSLIGASDAIIERADAIERGEASDGG